MGEGWIVAEATVANAQLFWRRSDAEAAACGFAARVAHAGEARRIEIRLRNGVSGGRLLSTMSEGRRRLEE